MIGSVKEYPNLHKFRIPRHTWSMIAWLFLGFPVNIASWECCQHAVVWSHYFSIVDSSKLYLTLTGLSLVVPFLHVMQFVHMCNLFFMPMMGRVGSEINADIVIAVLSLLPVFILSTYLVGNNTIIWLQICIIEYRLYKIRFMTSCFTFS